MSGHAPGPWRVTRERGAFARDSVEIMAADNASVALVAVWRPNPETLANARLIAAAPALYDAARALFARYGWPDAPEFPEWCEREWLALLDAVLAAEGIDP